MSLPPYSYVPGGPWPHPISSPQGHLAGVPHVKPPPIDDEAGGTGSPTLVEGALLFNSGYYWEAHEVWEGLWHAQRRVGASADLLKALIKLAAAGVKVREGQPHGIETHARRAQLLIQSLRDAVGPIWLGIELEPLEAFARSVADHPVAHFERSNLAVVRVFDFPIQGAGWDSLPEP